jgi:hypothetical protein
MAINKAIQKIDMIRHSFKYNAKMIFTSMVRLHLEYAVVFWNPHYQKHINNIEKIQH